MEATNIQNLHPSSRNNNDSVKLLEAASLALEVVSRWKDENQNQLALKSNDIISLETCWSILKTF